jgi:uncharacterized protein YqeY
MRNTGMLFRKENEKAIVKILDNGGKNMLLDKIKTLRIEAMKSKDSVARFAYEAVIGECQTFAGRGNELTEDRVVKILKKEIDKYKEMPAREKEVQLLSILLPEEKPQLTQAELKEIFETKLLNGEKNPKEFMRVLDETGYVGRYNKGMAAKVALEK